MRKELSHVILELHNVKIEPSSMKKSKGTTKCEKELSYVMLEPHNVRMKPSNVRKKKSKGTTKCEKITITCDVGTT